MRLGQPRIVLEAIRALADRPDDVGHDLRARSKPHRLDGMKGLVQRRTQEVVHRGVDDDEGLIPLALDPEDPGHERAGRPCNRAPRLDQDPPGETFEGRENRRGVGLGRQRVGPDADPASDVDGLDRKPGGRKLAARATRAPARSRPAARTGGSGCRCAPGCPRVAHGRARAPARRSRERGDVDAELVLLQARRDVGVGARVDVRVDPQGDARGAAERPGRGVDPFDLALGLGVEGEDAGLDPDADLLVRLADAGEDDAVGGKARSRGTPAAPRPRRRPRLRRAPRGGGGSPGSSWPWRRSRRGARPARRRHRSAARPRRSSRRCRRRGGCRARARGPRAARRHTPGRRAAVQIPPRGRTIADRASGRQVFIARAIGTESPAASFAGP